MAVRVSDFRRHNYKQARIRSAGKYVGNDVFWQLYEIENSFRIIAHSILLSQIGTNWWDIAVDARVRGDVERAQKKYANKPWLSTQNVHNIYFVLLSDLTEIFRANSHLFLSTIPDIDDWIARLESVRPPRNLVAHMNFPLAYARKRIATTHRETYELLDSLSSNRAITLEIP